MKELAAMAARPFVWTYHKTHWFTDAEAWGIYRFFAILEAVGWSLLILAIVYRYAGLPQAESVVSFAGHIHGIGFGLYFIFTLLVARSMEWGVWRIGVAIIAGMPPYGSLVFEQYMAHHRKKNPPQVTPPQGYDD